ncbi:TIGR03862 family flavoprotein [Brachymonas denitrificans]|uniref:TIGR03862 family flavoprotein n=1 Tax=Brachymonas denitrificans TaxID=28220 RepID=UPI0024C4C09F|nr:TIGR03862 family flavoprotein [Brachymonas denitrificans]
MTSTPIPESSPLPVAIIGAGPAGLMAAERLSAAGVPVHVFDAMPSAGRKFLLAGKGGLNLTHSEPFAAFAARYGRRQPQVEPLLRAFDAEAVRAWAGGLGVETFVGTSGRVFPKEMKAAPLLRAWMQRLRHPASGVPVQFHMRHRWLGFARPPQPGEALALCFQTANGERSVPAGRVLLALGGASWPRLGSDGRWVKLLQERDIALAPLLPANCGFDVAPTTARQAEQGTAPADAAPGGWSRHFRERFAGQPFKAVAIDCDDGQGGRFHRRGEFVATETGIEGSVVYAASHLLRDAILRSSQPAELRIDLLPDHSLEQVLAAVRHPRGSKSLSGHLKSRLGLQGIKAALLYELLDKAAMHDPERLAQAIKALPLPLAAARPVEEAISSAGGVCFEALDAQLRVRALPQLACAGEMLDWEAPTGGYLLTACLASGVVAAQGLLEREAA